LCQFISTQDEANDLLNAYKRREEEEEEAAVEAGEASKNSSNNVLWDLSEEDGSVESFPSFESTGIDPAR